MKKYNSYKNSGIEWLGNIPENWSIKRLKDISNLQFSNVDKKTKDNQKQVLLCNYVDVYKNDFITSELDFMPSTASDSEIKRFKVQKGDILCTKDSESFNDIANSAFVLEDLENVICGYHLAQIRTNDDLLDPSYLHRLIQSVNYNFWFSINAKGITRVGLSINSFTNAMTPVPPLKEQTAIAHFLDAKTQAIDKKITLLERKIIHYKNLRKSLINEVVTKGLDKTVRLKDSGIDWIGKIPEHWEVKRLKHLGNLETSSVNKKIEEDEVLVKLVNYMDIYNNPTKEIRNNDEFMVVSANNLQVQFKKLKKGDVLFTPSSETIEDIGVSAVVMEDLKNTLYSYHILRLRFTKHVDDSFKKYLFNNDFVQTYFSKTAKGTTRKILGLNDFNSLSIIVPPLNEQIEIAEFLDRKTTLITSTITNIET